MRRDNRETTWGCHSSSHHHRRHRLGDEGVSVILLFASMLLLVMMLMISPVHSVPNRLRICYLDFGTITDLGWTFTYNQGRLKIHDTLVTEFPNTTIESVSVQNVAFAANKSDVISRFIETGCNVVSTNNDQLLGGFSENAYYATKYPNVSFVLLGESWLRDHTLSNLVYIANDYTGGYYAAGAAAGAQAKRCIAFISAWDNETDPTSSFAGFLLGVRRQNATIPVHVIAQQSWYDPSGDIVLSDLFMRVVGCDILARYSDPFGVDVAVYSSVVSGGEFSVGCHSNLQQYVGDTVLTSIYVDWSVALLPPIRSLLVNGSLNQQQIYFPGLAEGGIQVARLSPLASRQAVAAFSDAVAYVSSTPSVVCGPIALRKGGFLQYPNGTTCKVPDSQIGDFITDAHVVQHPSYRAPSQCGAGTSFTYTFSPELNLVCTPCPENYFSSTAGSSTCTLCPKGQLASSGSSGCYTPVLLSQGAVVGICLGCVGLLVLVVLFMIWQSAVRKRAAGAPRKGPLCLVLTDVQGCVVLWRLQPAEMMEAMKRHDKIVRAVIANNPAYEVRKNGDGFVIATQSVLDGMIIALEIQRLLMKVQWPALNPTQLGESGPEWNGLRVSVGVHYCREDRISVKFDPLLHRYSYDGIDAVIAGRVGALAYGGQIVCTKETLDALMADNHFQLLLAEDMSISLWAVDCRFALPRAYTNPSRGEDTMSSIPNSNSLDLRHMQAALPGTGCQREEVLILFSIAPIELNGRSFPSCAIGKPPLEAPHQNGISGTVGMREWDTLDSADDSRKQINPTTTTTMILMLLAWVSVSNRKTIVNILLSTLRSAEEDKAQRSWSGRKRPSDSNSGSGFPGGTTLDASVFKNPKRLAAAAAISITSSMGATNQTSGSAGGATHEESIMRSAPVLPPVAVPHSHQSSTIRDGGGAGNPLIAVSA